MNLATFPTLVASVLILIQTTLDGRCCFTTIRKPHANNFRWKMFFQNQKSRWKLATWYKFISVFAAFILQLQIVYSWTKLLWKRKINDASKKVFSGAKLYICYSSITIQYSNCIKFHLETMERIKIIYNSS